MKRHCGFVGLPPAQLTGEVVYDFSPLPKTFRARLEMIELFGTDSEIVTRGHVQETVKLQVVGQHGRSYFYCSHMCARRYQQKRRVLNEDFSREMESKLLSAARGHP